MKGTQAQEDPRFKVTRDIVHFSQRRKQKRSGLQTNAKMSALLIASSTPIILTLKDCASLLGARLVYEACQTWCYSHISVYDASAYVRNIST